MKNEFQGLFWKDVAPVKQERRTPPPRTWEEPGYLPYLSEAKSFKVDLATRDDLERAIAAKEIHVFDCEVYPNYFLAGFCSVETGKIFYFEQTDSGFYNSFKETFEARGTLLYVLENLQLVGFNSANFDVAICNAAVLGNGTIEQLKRITDDIIGNGSKPWEALRSEKIKPIRDIDHIDLIHVLPGAGGTKVAGGLKLFAGRVHAPRLQELPFSGDTVLSPDQIAIVRWYCINSDLVATAFLHEELRPQIELRRSMSEQHLVDLRSKSDPQIAEAVIAQEIRREIGTIPRSRFDRVGESFDFEFPKFWSCETDVLKSVADIIDREKFSVKEDGHVALPDSLSKLKITIGTTSYQLGLGGLHSCEECTTHVASSDNRIFDFDVTSYYPSLILLLGLEPENLAGSFLNVFKNIVDRRISAKKSRNKVESESLKIVLNGTFGKFSSPYSFLYSPRLGFHVTITGQLALLMLIERLELCGIKLVSANTDGIVLLSSGKSEDEIYGIVEEWEHDTGLSMEKTEYSSLHSRDVNHYIAIKTDGGVKSKGFVSGVTLANNPTANICTKAAIEFLKNKTPVEKTISESRDIRDFIFVRTVKGGAVRDGEYLGKAIRWYWRKDNDGEIVYAKSGNKVAESDGGKPCQDLPHNFPDDVDVVRYVNRANDILSSVGVVL